MENTTLLGVGLTISFVLVSISLSKFIAEKISEGKNSFMLLVIPLVLIIVYCAISFQKIKDINSDSFHKKLKYEKVTETFYRQIK